jgi:hypothetical protein
MTYKRGIVSLPELLNMPNRYMYWLRHAAYIRNLKAQKDPNGPEAKELKDESLMAAFSGQE